MNTWIKKSTLEGSQSTAVIQLACFEPWHFHNNIFCMNKFAIQYIFLKKLVLNLRRADCGGSSSRHIVWMKTDPNRCSYCLCAVKMLILWHQSWKEAIDAAISAKIKPALAPFPMLYLISVKMHSYTSTCNLITGDTTVTQLCTPGNFIQGRLSGPSLLSLLFVQHGACHPGDYLLVLCPLFALSILHYVAS